jgi:transposase
MFLREKTSKNSKKPILQIVENYRKGDKVSQRLVVSLGTNLVVPKEIRKQVSRAVRERLLGQTTLIDDPQINGIVDRIIKKIQTDGKWDSTRNQVLKFKQDTKDQVQTAKIFVDDVEHGNDRILGPLLIGHSFWHRLGLPGILSSCGFSDNQIKTAEISVLDRLIAQDSEHAIPSWIKTAAVEDLIISKAEDYGDDRFHHISDKLLNSQYTIEEQLYERENNLFNLNNAVYLYDLTNTYFEGLCKSNPKAQFNKNQKEKRTDCRQIVIALVLDQEGFIRRHRIFNGKMTDVKSLDDILKVLKKDFQGTDSPTIIMDRGVACDENIELVESHGLKYIVATRSNEEIHFINDFLNSDFKVLKDNKNNKVEVLLKKEGDKTYLLCKSKLKKAKEQSMRNQAEERLDKDIAKLATLIQTGQRVDPLAIERSIGRIKERHSRVSHYYEIEYIPFSFEYQIPKDAVIAKRLLNSLFKLKEKVDQYKISHVKLKSNLEKLSQKYPQDYEKVTIVVKVPIFTGEPIDEKREKLQPLDGNYLLKMNRDDLSDCDIWNMYVMLTRVEGAFRNLKTDLKLQPNFHQKEIRVDGHVFITLLAYHLLHSIEHTLRENGCSSSWATIKRIVSNHTYSTIILPTTSGTVIHLRKSGKPEAIHQDIYRKLNIKVDDLPVNKILV